MSKNPEAYSKQYLAELQQQHGDAVEDILVRHMLWNPRCEHPVIPPEEPAFVTVVVLNDERTFHVQTPLSDGGTKVYGETTKAARAR